MFPSQELRLASEFSQKDEFLSKLTSTRIDTSLFRHRKFHTHLQVNCQTDQEEILLRESNY